MEAGTSEIPEDFPLDVHDVVNEAETSIIMPEETRRNLQGLNFNLGTISMNLVEINELELLMGHLMLNEINITNIELDTLDIREGAINLNTINIEETSIQDINIPRVYINDEVDIGTASIKTVEIS